MPHPRLTPAMRNVLERRARVCAPPLHTLPPAQARAAYEAAAGVLEVPRATLRRVDDFTVPARDGHPLPARLYADAAGSGPWPWLLYLHGGGFTIGSIATHDTLCRELARLSGCAVVSLDYRLAPSTAFPLPSTMPGTPCSTWSHTARIEAWTHTVSPSGETAPAARWQRCAP